jgi:hypothetical protein
MLLNLLKVLLLMLGAAMIVGGSLTGLCGVIVKEGELAMMGFVPAALGLWMFIAISRSFRKKDQQTSTESGEEQPPATQQSPEQP